MFRSSDRLGLDPDDEIGNHGFADWFALQHWDRFDGRYQPPIAAVEVERSFSGSL